MRTLQLPVLRTLQLPACVPCSWLLAYPVVGSLRTLQLPVLRTLQLAACVPCSWQLAYPAVAGLRTLQSQRYQRLQPGTDKKRQPRKDLQENISPFIRTQPPGEITKYQAAYPADLRRARPPLHVPTGAEAEPRPVGRPDGPPREWELPVDPCVPCRHPPCVPCRHLAYAKRTSVGLTFPHCVPSRGRNRAFATPHAGSCRLRGTDHQDGSGSMLISTPTRRASRSWPESAGKSRRRRAYPQQIVTTRLLYCLQDPFAQLSRLQRI